MLMTDLNKSLRCHCNVINSRRAGAFTKISYDFQLVIFDIRFHDAATPTTAHKRKWLFHIFVHKSESFIFPASNMAISFSSQVIWTIALSGIDPDPPARIQLSLTVQSLNLPPVFLQIAHTLSGFMFMSISSLIRPTDETPLARRMVADEPLPAGTLLRR
jgi:hypothetical protein